jgi:REP element-mobilizing transposase RayT
LDKNIVYFYTASIYKWIPILHDDELKEIVINSLKFLVSKRAIKLYGFVIMPNHIHLIIKLIGGSPISNFQLSFMRYTAQKIKFYLHDNKLPILHDFLVHKKDRSYQFWQRNPLAKEMPSREICEQKLDYIHNNPVQGRWLLANSPQDYRYSSVRFYELEEKGEYPFLTHYMEVYE